MSRKGKKNYRLLAFFLVALARGAMAQDWSATLPTTLDKMVSGYCYPSISAAFGTFTYGYSDLSSPFSRWLEERLADGAVQSHSLKILNLSAAAAMDPAFKAIYSGVFAVNNVEGLLHGDYFDDGDCVRARLEITGLSDGLLIGTAEIRIPKRCIPEGMPIAPEQGAAARSAELSSIIDAKSGPRPDATLRLSVSTDRGKSAVYREGEKMKVLVGLSRDAYLKVYHIDVNGKVQLIWPNRFSGGSGFVRAGNAICIPEDDAPFQFLMTPPYGTEFIKAVASTAPFAGKEDDFTDLDETKGAGARSVITRGISVVPKSDDAPPPSMAEATASYSIMEAR
jgi:hypothetical protein